MNHPLLRLLAVFIALCIAVDSSAQTKFRGVTVSTGVTEADLLDLATWKPNFIRIPLAWDEADSADEATYDAWLTSRLESLDAILAVCAAQNIKVVLALHSPPGGFVNRGSAPLHRVFAEEWAERDIIEVWQEIAQRYVGNTTIWGYDILNEPAQASVAQGRKDWNALAADIITAIRVQDSTVKIIVEAVYGDRITRLTKQSDLNVTYSFHMYYPLQFQHQGLYGRKFGVQYPNPKLTKKDLRKYIKKFAALQKKFSSPVYIGEFSAVRWAPKNSAYRYLKDVISIFEEYGLDWTYHSFREADPWSVEHTTNKNDSTRSTKQTDRERLLRQFFAKNT